MQFPVLDTTEQQHFFYEPPNLFHLALRVAHVWHTGWHTHLAHGWHTEKGGVLAKVYKLAHEKKFRSLRKQLPRFREQDFALAFQVWHGHF